jgi:hypothetical protein
MVHIWEVIMTNYWVISPYDSAKDEIWERAWGYDLSHDVIAIGWRELGDISVYDKDQLEKAVKHKWPDLSSRRVKFAVDSMWNFWHEIEVDDIVVARKGTKQLAAIGSVSQTAFYDVEMGKDRVGGSQDYYPNFIGVRWHASPRDVSFDKMVFAYPTIYKTSKEGYDKIVEIVEEVSELLGPEEEEKPIVPEKALEELIASNFDRLFQGRLELVSSEGNIARQYLTGVGTIDLLAKERETDALVVIELKAGREADKVVGQTLRYMGWIDEFLCEDEQQVKGIIVCEGADPKLLAALRMTPEIDLKYYSIDINLEDVDVKRSQR